MVTNRQVPIEQIKIGERIRKNPGNLESLASSMKKLGLLCPVLLTSDHTLVHGYRRIKAAKLIGWTEIACRIADNFDDALAALWAERDENTEREPLGPLEILASVEKIQKLTREKFPEKETIPFREICKVNGHSGRKVEKIRMVRDAAAKDPATHGTALEQMVRTRDVEPAYQAVKDAGKDARGYWDSWQSTVSKLLRLTGFIEKSGGIVMAISDLEHDHKEVQIELLESLVGGLTKALNNLKEHVHEQKKPRRVK